MLGNRQGYEYDTIPRIFLHFLVGYGSRGGGIDGTAHISSGQMNGNRYVPILNTNDSKRNLNLNNWDDEWNGHYRFLAVRYFSCFSRYP